MKSLTLKMEATLGKNFIISIDMGGTKILAAAINSDERIVSRVKKSTKLHSSQKEYVKNLKDIVDNLLAKSKIKNSNIKAVCLGIPGNVNPFTGKVGIAPNLGLKNFNIKEKLQEQLPFPVLVENDVNLGALGIKRFGVGKGSINFLTVFVGTGIGGALVFDEKIYRGSDFVAGEIGHTIVQKNGPICGCGNHGCFEAIASRTAIVRNIRNDIKSGKKSIISTLIKPNQKIKSKVLSEALKAEDKVVVNRISEACDTIGLVLANISNLLNLDKIVLGGGLIEAAESFMMPKIKYAFKEYALKEVSKKIKIVSSKLGDDAALYGGIELAEEFLGIKV